MLVTNSTGTGLFFRTTSRTSFCSLTGVAWVDQNNTDCALADAVANSDSPNPTSNCAAGRFICFIQFSLCNIGRYRPKSNRFKTSPKTFLEKGVSQLAGLKKRGFTLVFEQKNQTRRQRYSSKGKALHRQAPARSVTFDRRCIGGNSDSASTTLPWGVEFRGVRKPAFPRQDHRTWAKPRLRHSPQESAHQSGRTAASGSRAN